MKMKLITNSAGHMDLLVLFLHDSNASAQIYILLIPISALDWVDELLPHIGSQAYSDSNTMYI